jgi:DNA adenine methylase
VHAWLRWAGSKMRSIGRLRPVFEAFEYDFYIEPFLGAGTVFFHLIKSVPSILNDTNRDLVTFYRLIKSCPSALWRELSRFPHRVTPREYLLFREKFNQASRGLHRAAMFFFLNRTCFNGIYRINRCGKFNVPAGRLIYRYPPIEALFTVSQKLKCAQLTHGDFFETLDHARPGVLYYLDPPYTRTGAGRGYDRYSWPPFREEDLTRLSVFIQSALALGAAVIVSYGGRARPWFVPSDLSVKAFKVFRSVSSDGARGDRSELCAYACPDRGTVGFQMIHP